MPRYESYPADNSDPSDWFRLMDGARNTLASLKGIRNRQPLEAPLITQDDAINARGYGVIYINSEGQKVMKRVQNIKFGPIGLRAFVRDEPMTEVA